MQRQRIIRVVLIVLCAAVFVWSSVQLVNYATDAWRSKRLSKQLKDTYYTATAEPTELIPVTEQPTATPEPQITAISPTRTPSPTQDPFGGYPNNRYRQVAERFAALRKNYHDVCAWLSIDGVLDEAVVQRDNKFYLDHDYSGMPNVNGALFLEEDISLMVRPTAYIIYGHNMKTQAMFGKLNKYSDKTFLREHAIMTFDTMYEDGQFAVFAAGELSLDPNNYRFAAFYELPVAKGEQRMQIIQKLKDDSDQRIDLDMSAEDQLLLLITCTGDDHHRRFVAARRLREGEDAQSLDLTYWTVVPQGH